MKNNRRDDMMPQMDVDLGGRVVGVYFMAPGDISCVCGAK